MSAAKIRRQVTSLLHGHRQLHMPHRIRGPSRGSLLHLRPTRHVELRTRPPTVLRSEPTRVGQIQIGNRGRSADRILRSSLKNVFAVDTGRHSNFHESQRGATNIREKRPSRAVPTPTEPLERHVLQVSSLSLEEPPPHDARAVESVSVVRRRQTLPAP